MTIINKDNVLNYIIQYETEREMEYNDVIALFQYLVNSGLAWKLQGHYGRTAMNFIIAGVVAINTKNINDIIP